MPYAASFTTINFVGASDPALTPTPFSSVTETAGNDALYGAAVGTGGTPGMRCTFGGTTADCYGTLPLPMVVQAAGRIFEASCDWLAPVLPFAGLSGPSHTIIQFRSATTNLVALRIIKINATDLVIRAVDSIGAVGTNGTTVLAAATYYNMEVQMDCTNPSQVRVYLNGNLEATQAIATPIADTANELRVGAVAAGTNPVITIEYNLDNIACQLSGFAGTQAMSGVARSFSRWPNIGHGL